MIWKTLFQTLSPAGVGAKLSVLIFHRVLTVKDPLLASEPDAREFELRMRWITRWFNVLPVPEAVRCLKEGTLPARALCVTFDDGYADNVNVALPILKRHGVCAAFFIATAYLNGGRMWNDSIIETIRRCDSGPLDLSEFGLGTYGLESISQRLRAIDSLLAQLKYLAPSQRADLVAAIAERAPAGLPSDLMMRSEDVRKLDDAGMTIGGHTHTHPILTRVDQVTAEREIASGREALEGILKKRPVVFAFPNGRPHTDYETEHVRLVRRMGFDAAFSTAWGAARAGSDLFQLPRFTPWDRSRWRFGIRLARNLNLPEPSIA